MNIRVGSKVLIVKKNPPGFEHYHTGRTLGTIRYITAIEDVTDTRMVRAIRVNGFDDVLSESFIEKVFSNNKLYKIILNIN